MTHDMSDQQHSTGAPARTGFLSGRATYERYLLVRAVFLITDLIAFTPLILLAILSRFVPRPVDIGLGPIPTINSRYHKQALEGQGYSCETFVYKKWYMTADFDVDFSRYDAKVLGPYITFVFVLFRYRCLYVYFSGGPLDFTTLLSRLEPFLYRLAGIKTVVMPYGSDIQVLTRCKNLPVIDGYSRDYPGGRLTVKRTAALVDTWTRGADHVISGCDWVDYMYFWDTLMLAHFTIDTAQFEPEDTNPKHPGADRPFRLLHAPNHRNLKGTAQIVRAVDVLRREGADVELVILEGVPNAEVPNVIRSVDVVVDQLVLGWYAMFAIEAMALAKPVVCHIRPDYLDLYTGAGLIEPDELPLIDSSVHSIEKTIRDLLQRPAEELRQIGVKSRTFVEKHHSTGAVGRQFARINRQIGLLPSLDLKTE